MLLCIWLTLNLIKCTFSRVTNLVRLKNYDSDDMKYSPGDHLCVYPSNNSKMVKELLIRCENSTNEDEVIEVQFDKGGISRNVPIIRAWFKYALKIKVSCFYNFIIGTLINFRVVQLMGTTRAFPYDNNTDRFIYFIFGYYFTSKRYTSFNISRMRHHFQWENGLEVSI